MIILKVFLHGKPNWYLPIEGKTVVNPTVIRLYADQLKEHLYTVANTIYKLQKNSWYLLRAYGAMYYLEYCKFDVKIEETKKELQNLGINEHQVIVEELNLKNVH